MPTEFLSISSPSTLIGRETGSTTRTVGRTWDPSQGKEAGVWAGLRNAQRPLTHLQIYIN
jgi:hypothetical protein